MDIAGDRDERQAVKTSRHARNRNAPAGQRSATFKLERGGPSRRKVRHGQRIGAGPAKVINDVYRKWTRSNWVTSGPDT